MLLFERLSLELLDQILEQLPKRNTVDQRTTRFSPYTGLRSRTLLPLYATVSKTWKSYFERRLFKSLNLDSDELEEATAILTGDRRLAITRINFRIRLPSYDTHSYDRCETNDEQEENNIVYSAAITNLFKFLKFLDGEQAQHSGPEILIPKKNSIALSIDRIYSPSDLTHKSNCDTVERGPGYDLTRHRFWQSFLHLRDIDMPPRIERVNSFSIAAWSRKVSPSALVLVASCLPSLEILDLELADEQNESPEIRRQMRNDFANALPHLPCTLLRMFRLEYKHEGPSNHHLSPSSALDPTSPLADHLSVGLHSFFQRENLTTITLSGPIVISPSLFWPDKLPAGSVTPYWPALKSFEVTFSPCTPDGDWYFIRPPNRKPENDFLDQVEELWLHPMEEEEWTSDDEYEFLDLFEEARVLKTLSDEQAEPDNNGNEDVEAEDFPLREFRTWPNDEKILPLIKSMARAAACMPAIEELTIGLSDDYFNPRFKISFTNPRFDYELSLGRKLDVAYRLSVMTRKSEPQWKMDEECLDLWRLAVPRGGGELCVDYGLSY